MNNTTQMHRPSPVNRYLDIAKQTKVPLAIYFADGDVIPSCIIVEVDSLNLLVKTVDLDGEKAVSQEFVITRACIKKIGSTLEHNHNRA
ncbi:MAG: hypothetical protein WBM24_08605 [Candidatus Sulfotelmatobacter sp.]